MERILGVDPGTIRMGYGLIDGSKDGNIAVVDWGVFIAQPRLLIGARLHYLYGLLVDLIEKYSPDQVVVERPFVSLNPKSAIAIGQAQGLLLMAAAGKNIESVNYSPREIKQSITGYGNASKDQVQQAVLMSLNMGVDTVPEDAADALAAAMCHMQVLRGNNLIVSD